MILGDEFNSGSPDTTSRPEAFPLVSIVIPCLNEEDMIGPCLQSIVEQDYPQDRLEILVVDGGSTDATVDIVQGFTRKHDHIRLLSNPRRIIPAALNIGIHAATGEYICRMDAHSTYNASHVSLCISQILSTKEALKVGGVFVLIPRTTSLVARAIAFALAHPFGVGNARFRLRKGDPVWADAAVFGCVSALTHSKVGVYDERFERGEDMEFNRRIREAGGKILLIPSVHCYYRPRSTLKALARQSFKDGYWITRPLAFGRYPYSWRHLIPGSFVSAILLLLCAGMVSDVAVIFAVVLVAAWITAALAAAIHLGFQNREWRLVSVLPTVFAALHFPYAAGSLVGLVSCLASGRSTPTRNAGKPRRSPRTVRELPRSRRK